jgi:hypothetical protein
MPTFRRGGPGRRAGTTPTVRPTAWRVVFASSNAGTIFSCSSVSIPPRCTTTGPSGVVTAKALSLFVSSSSSLVTSYRTSTPARSPDSNDVYFALLAPSSAATNSSSTVRASSSPGSPVQIRRKPM